MLVLDNNPQKSHQGGSLFIDIEPFHHVSVEMLDSDVDQPMTV